MEWVAGEPRIKAAALGRSGLMDGTEGPIASMRERLAAPALGYVPHR